MEDDKTYLWLVLLTFLALAVACAFSFLELSELQQPVQINDPFGSSQLFEFEFTPVDLQKHEHLGPFAASA